MSVIDVAVVGYLVGATWIELADFCGGKPFNALGQLVPYPDSYPE
jgi:hypothetical protein